MANSLIDDMFTENNQFNGNEMNRQPKKGKKKILLFFILIIILAGIFLFLFITKNKNKNIDSSKTEFLKYLSQNPMESITDINVFKDVFKTLTTKSNESDTIIKINSNIEEYDILTGIILDINTKYDSNNRRGLSDINLEYMDNPIFNMQTLITGKKVALKADEIVTKYVGYNLESLMNRYVELYSKTSEDIDNQNISDEDISRERDRLYNDDVIDTSEALMLVLKNIDYNYIIESFSSEFIQKETIKYSQILNTLPESNFTQKEVTLEKNTGNVATTAYTLTLNEEEIISIAARILEELKNDTELMSIFITALEPTSINLTEESFKLFVDQMINNVYELEGDKSVLYKFTLYVSNNKVIKMTIDTEEIIFEVDFDFYDGQSIACFTWLAKGINTGIRLEINRTSLDIEEKITCSFGVIQYNELVIELVSYLGIENINTETEMKIEFRLNCTDTERELSINGTTDIEFKDIEIEDLTNDNCLFLDELNDEERNIVIDSIITRTQEVFDSKINQISLINSNVNSSVIEGIEPDRTEGNEREAARDKIINAVASKMYEAQQNGESYTVNDIEYLIIEDVEEFSVTVENEIATVILNGYKFEINSKFELIEIVE